MFFFSKIQPLLFVFFYMLIKNEFQMAFRSAQKRPRTPHDARPPPTWSQHGANMGSKRGASIGPRGLEIWSRGGLKPESPSDLRMDPAQTPNGPQHIPQMELQIDNKSIPNRPPKSTSDGPSIDSQFDFKVSLRSVTRSSYSWTEQPCVGTT